MINLGDGHQSEPEKFVTIVKILYILGLLQIELMIIVGLFAETIYKCCSGSSLSLSDFNNNFLRKNISLPSGFKFGSTTQDFVIVSVIY